MLLALACSTPPDPPPPAPPAPPNVLLVVMDTTRADALSAYGNARRTSPQLDAIAEAGVRFTDVTAPAPWTWPVHASLFTGKQPWEHGAHSTVADEAIGATGRLRMTRLDPDLPTLAERFGAAGYNTVSISANRLVVPQLGLTRGFDVGLHHDTDAEVVAEAVNAIQGVEGPLLLFVNLMDAHQPWTPWPVPWQDARSLREPSLAGAWNDDELRMANRDGSGKSFDERFTAGELELSVAQLAALRGLYEGEVARVDTSLNALLDAWQGAGRGGVVAVTSDHGEALGEHRQIGHHHQLYDELVHVPLVLAGPGLPVGSTVDTPVSLTRLHDTLLDLAGLEGPASLTAEVEGAAGQPILSAVWPDMGWTDALGTSWGQGSRLYREQDLAVLWRDDGSTELYDLAIDADMTTDLAADRPDDAAALKARGLAAFGTEASGELLDRGDDETERLRALGYIE